MNTEKSVEGHWEKHDAARDALDEKFSQLCSDVMEAVNYSSVKYFDLMEKISEYGLESKRLGRLFMESINYRD